MDYLLFSSLSWQCDLLELKCCLLQSVTLTSLGVAWIPGYQRPRDTVCQWATVSARASSLLIMYYNNSIRPGLWHDTFCVASQPCQPPTDWSCCTALVQLFKLVFVFVLLYQSAVLYGLLGWLLWLLKDVAAKMRLDILKQKEMLIKEQIDKQKVINGV